MQQIGNVISYVLLAVAVYYFVKISKDTVNKIRNIKKEKLNSRDDDSEQGKEVK